MIGTAILAMLNLPTAAMIQAVRVVPRFAPMMTPIDSTKVRRPTLTNETTRTVVAEEDWTNPVVKSPVRTPLKRFPVTEASAERILAPANF